MVANIQNPVSNNYTHRVDLEQPLLFTFSQLGFGLKGLFDGDFLDHVLTVKGKNLFELYTFISEYVKIMQTQADATTIAYVKHQKPLPSLDTAIDISVDATFPHLLKLDTKDDISASKKLLELLRKDIKNVAINTQDILQSYFVLAKDLTTEFHSSSSDFINKLLSHYSKNVAFVVVGADTKIAGLFGDQIPAREFMRTEYSMDDDWTILYFFSIERMNKDTFLAIPLMLMHEFLSHIFTIDFSAGFRKIDSWAFLEGWMVWAIEEYLERYGQIRFLNDRIGSFRELRYDTYDSLNPKYSANIRMGRDTARWFCKIVKWEAFMKISQDLLLCASNPKEMSNQILSLNPRPVKNIHNEFIQRLNMIMRHLDGSKSELVYKKYVEIFPSPPNSLATCWAGIFDKSFEKVVPTI